MHEDVNLNEVKHIGKTTVTAVNNNQNELKRKVITDKNYLKPLLGTI